MPFLSHWRGGAIYGRFVSDIRPTGHPFHKGSEFAHESSTFYIPELPSNYVGDTNILQQKTIEFSHRETRFLKVFHGDFPGGPVAKTL